jgi:hypothetical protein
MFTFRLIRDLFIIGLGLLCAIRNDHAAKQAIRQQEWLWGIDASSSLSVGRWGFRVVGVIGVIFGLVDLIRGWIR